jgi:threonine/homoserine/homoserine lactone efflux protein
MSGPPKPGETGRGPLTFWQGAMFQWVNVKGWVAIIGTITAYAAIADFPLNIVIQVLTFLVMGAASITTWTLFGSALRPFLTSPKAVRAFNLVMAVLLLGSLYPVFTD